jgi:peptidoglycan hydrolase-like protein with peptidoglycan-binding domain
LLAAAILAGPAFASPPAPMHPMQQAAAHNEGLYRRAQERLKRLNFYHGPVNGMRTAAYVRALESFQHRRHLAANGRLDHATRSALGIA